MLRAFLYTVSVLLMLWFFGEPLFQHLLISLFEQQYNDDTRQFIAAFVLPDSDYITRYYLDCMPLGYRLLFHMLEPVVSPLIFSSLLQYILLGGAALFMALAAYRMAGGLGALIVVGFMLSSGVYLERIAGGLPRGFGYPIVAMAIYALVAEKRRLLAFAILIGPLFYPVSSVAAGLTLFACSVLPEKYGGFTGSKLNLKGAAFPIAVGLLCVVLILPTALSSSKYGSVIRSTDTESFAELKPRGRYASADRPPWDGIRSGVYKELNAAASSTGARAGIVPRRLTSSREAKPYYLALFCLIAAGFLGVKIYKNDPSSKKLLIFVVFVLISFIISRPIAPLFYLPQRHLHFTIPLVFHLLVAVGLADLSTRFANIFKSRPLLSSVVQIIPIMFLMFAYWGRGKPDLGLGVRFSLEQLSVVEYVKALPQGAVLAGWPSGFLESLPLLSMKPAIVTHETHQIFHSGFALEMRERTNALVKAYFGTQKEVEEFAQKYGVTHFLVNPGHFSATPPKYFKPFNREINRVAKQNQSSGVEPYLKQLSTSEGAFTSGSYSVVSVVKRN